MMASSPQLLAMSSCPPTCGSITAAGATWPWVTLPSTSSRLLSCEHGQPCDKSQLGDREDAQAEFSVIMIEWKRSSEDGAQEDSSATDKSDRSYAEAYPISLQAGLQYGL